MLKINYYTDKAGFNSVYKMVLNEGSSKWEETELSIVGTIPMFRKNVIETLRFNDLQEDEIFDYKNAWRNIVGFGRAISKKEYEELRSEYIKMLSDNS